MWEREQALFVYGFNSSSFLNLAPIFFTNVQQPGRGINSFSLQVALGQSFFITTEMEVGHHAWIVLLFLIDQSLCFNISRVLCFELIFCYNKLLDAPWCFFLSITYNYNRPQFRDIMITTVLSSFALFKGWVNSAVKDACLSWSHILRKYNGDIVLLIIIIGLICTFFCFSFSWNIFLQPCSWDGTVCSFPKIFYNPRGLCTEANHKQQNQKVP